MVAEETASACAAFLRDNGFNYALLDGARDGGVRAYITEHAPDALSLYAGFDEELVDVAPYLIQLTPERIDALIGVAWGNSWGVFLKSTAHIEELRRHFRKFLMVRLEDDEEVYFRFYDPRVLRLFLPACTREEWLAFFGSVQSFLVEPDDPTRILSFTAASPGEPQALALAAE